MNEPGKVKPQWFVREYQEGDEEQILELRKIVLSGPRDIQWWKWQFKDRPAGPATIWLADAKSNIVGHHAFSPLSMKIGNQVCKNAVAIDVMTHPDYQRQGILKALTAQGFESNVKNGISLSYGTSTTQTLPIYRRLKSSYNNFDICELPLLVKVISLGKVLKKHFGIPVFIGNPLVCAWELIVGRALSSEEPDIEIEQITSFDESINAFWQKASEIKPIMLVRDMKYLNWRYVEKPEDEYVIYLARKQKEIAGYIVAKKIEAKTITRGAIIDLLTLQHEDTVAKALITTAINYLRSQGAAIISCLMLPDAPYYRILKKMGFMRRRSGLQLSTRLYDQNLSKELVADPGNWYFVWGDTDTT